MDERATPEAGTDPPAGSAQPTQPGFDDLRRRLADSAGESRARLTSRLQHAVSLHDLTRRDVLVAHRDIRRLQRIGALPTPMEYWKRSALPKASLLIDSSMAAVAEEGKLLGDAIDRFLDEANHSTMQPWASSRSGRSAIQGAATSAIDQLLHAVPPTESIDRLGAWWQRRLRRAAILRALPRLLWSSVDADLVIGTVEMALLDNPPWSHGDRLLSAFELAHGEIRTRTRSVADGLTSRVAGFGSGALPPQHRVTIELRQ